MKKIMAMVLVILVTMMTCAAVVSAATESDIITALKSAGVPASYIASAESYLAKSDVVLTAAQSDAIIVDINDAVAIAAGQKSYSKLTGDQKSKIAAEITDAAKILGMTTSYSSTAGLSIIDSTGKVLITVNTEDAVKQTGFDYTIVIVGLALIGTAGVSAVVIRKVTRREKKILNAA